MKLFPCYLLIILTQVLYINYSYSDKDINENKEDHSNQTNSNLVSTNPARGYDVLGELKISTVEEIAGKVFEAHKAQRQWHLMGLDNRKAYLENVLDIMKQNRQALIIRTMEEMGATRKMATAFAINAENIFRWNLDNADNALATRVTFDNGQEINEIIKEPWGVIASINPWNYVLPNFVQSISPPLLAGNVVIIKFSEEVPLLCQFLESLVLQSNMPQGVISFVYGDGDVGSILSDQNIDMIAFTGSHQVGHQLSEKAAQKFIPILTELGGSSPGIVFSDCHVDDIVESVFWDRFVNTGQFCNNMKRLIVHESLFDEMVQKLSAYAQSKIIGDPQDSGTEFSSLVSERQVVKLERQLQDAIDKGANLVCGGNRPEKLKGAYFEPTLLTNIDRKMRVWSEEVFGPILPIVSFKTYEEAIELANDTDYGLSAVLYTNDQALAKKAASDIKAGSIHSYGTTCYRPQNTFGGFKKSGTGRVRGLEGFEGYVQTKTVARKK